MEISVDVKNLSICFNLASEKIDSVKDYFIKRLKKRISVNTFWAVNDVSFCVEKGEALGIVGLNGSGKSTLLKMIAGILKPTKGSVYTNGDIAPLIELSAGFNPDLSARENVFLNGALLGHDRNYMRERFEKIIQFAELESFVEAPVKNYSSGMLSRLGFAIATMNHEEIIQGQEQILILDEVLAVGDYKFQEKSLARTKQMIHSGATVLFVSHSAESVRELCTRVIWLHKGKLIADGPAETIMDAYTELDPDTQMDEILRLGTQG